VQRTVVALQFEDRFSQRLLHVSNALLAASHMASLALSCRDGAQENQSQGLPPAVLNMVQPAESSEVELF
jgi:hypothetical protein